MSSPRDRDGADDGSDWQEPSHLSGNEPADDDEPKPNFADRRSTPRDSDHTAEGATWQPPGWDLPAATPDRDLSAATPDRDLSAATPDRDLSAATPDRDMPAVPPDPDRQPDVDPTWQRPSDVDPTWGPPPGPPVPPQERTRRGLFGPRARGEVEKVFTYEGDVVGAQGWALQQGWTISDGNAPEDAVLKDLVASAPVRPTKDHRPASVLRGRSGRLDLVAFDIVYASGRYVVPEYAVTAAPLLGAVPGLRLTPARFWKHRIGGLVPITSGDEAFDARWMLLAAEDSPQVRRLAQDPAVHGLLLGTDDGDEFWTAAGHLAVVRPDGHRPQLLEHHARLLSAVVGALSAGY